MDIYVRLEHQGGVVQDIRKLVTARFVKDRYTPYSELTATLIADTNVTLSDIRRVAFYINSKRMHYGPADFIRTRVRGGRTMVEVISRGVTLMLGQNEPEPGVWSKVSLTEIMKSYSPSSEITYEGGTAAVNYVNINEKSTLWEAIGVYGVKAYGRRAYIKGDRQVAVTLSSSTVDISSRRVIEYGGQLDTRLMLSKVYMKNVDGEYGYSYQSSGIVPFDIVREKYYGLDRQWLSNVNTGLKDRIDHAEREHYVEHITYEGYCGEDLTDRISCAGYGVNRKRVSRLEVTADNFGLKTKLWCE